MAYYEVSQFNAGIDLRKASVNAPAGTMRMIRNAHVGPGGEIEKAFAFNFLGAAPPTSRGLAGDSRYGYTFMSTSDATPGWVGTPPTPISLGVIAIPHSTSINRVLDWELFDNKFYVIIEDLGGNILHFYGTTDYNTAAVTGVTGTNVKTFKTKMNAVNGSQLQFSAVNNPADWTTGTGKGFINLAAEDADMQQLVGVEVYYDQLAIMSAYATQLWAMDPDPAKNQFRQTLRQAGTIAPRSVRQYGSGDVLYLSADGIRSLKAKDQSLAAAVSDIGSPIDSMIQGFARDMGVASYLSKAISLLEPYTGRFWVVLPDRILVLSAFPTPRITAWSQYSPGFELTAAAVAGDRIMVRDTEGLIFVYGGVGAPTTRAFAERDSDPTLRSVTYIDQEVYVEFPFLSMDKPATNKQFQSIDISCEGTWEIYAAFDPTNPAAEDFLGTATQPTFPAQRFGMTGYSTHCSIRLRNKIPGEKATVSSFIFHYEMAEAG